MSKLNVKPVASGLYHHSYNPYSVISLDFAQLCPERVLEVLPRDRFSISGESTLRSAPQIFPPFGKAYLKTAAFFVPEYQLIEYSEAFRSNMNYWKGKSVVCPTFRSTTLSSLFGRSVNGLASQVYVSSNPTTDSGIPNVSQFDFVQIVDNAGAPNFRYCLLNTLGRYYYKVFKSLGYDFPSYVYHALTTDTNNSGQFSLNALPLLAYAKIYADMFLYGTQYNYNELVHLLHAIHDGEDFTDSGGNLCYTASTGIITEAGLLTILYAIRLPHEQNLYTEAWNSPNSPSGIAPGTEINAIGNPPSQSLLSPYLENDPYTMQESISSTKDGNIYANNAGTVYTLSAKGNKFLMAFDKFVKRFGLFGSKAVQRVYAGFGVKSDDFKTHFVHKIYEGQSQISFYPVMSNADTQGLGVLGKPIGSFAGYAQGGLNFDFSYKSQEFGYIIVLSWVQIVPLILRGVHPANLRIKPFDFWTPEFDGKAVRAVPLCEVGTNRLCNGDPNQPNVGDKEVYGFINLYDDMRELRDVIAGDFITGSSSNRNFLFCRDFSVLRESGNGNVCKPQSDYVQQYDQNDNPDMSDPFQKSKSYGDRFWLGTVFKINAQRPVLSSSDAIDFTGEGDLQINKNGTIMN